MESLKKQLIGLSQFEVTKMIGLSVVNKLGLNSSERIVLLALSMHIDGKYQCYPSYGRLVDVTALSESTIKRSITKLVSVGYVDRKTRKTENGGNSSNLYTLNIQKINGGEKYGIKKDDNKVVAFHPKKGYVTV